MGVGDAMGCIWAPAIWEVIGIAVALLGTPAGGLMPPAAPPPAAAAAAATKGKKCQAGRVR